VVAALAHLPFRLADLTPESSPCSCAHWHMPSLSLALPPCMNQLPDDEPDRVVVFSAENGVALSGAVFLPSPPAKSSRPATSLPPPCSGGVVRLQPFPPFDMLLPQSLYNSKGAGMLPSQCLNIERMIFPAKSHSILQRSSCPLVSLPSEWHLLW
jgi:hypothetical protein